ncbi:hypothetical protein HGB13_02385 [bacterium]|nr:hypothetical protein [bacterium]
MPAKKKTPTKKVIKKKVTTRKKISKVEKIKEPVIKEEKMEVLMPEPAQEEQNEMDPALEDNAIYSWDAPEFLYHEKSALWHVFVYTSIAALTLLMVFLKQWFSIPVFLLIGVLVFQYAEVKPKHISVTITNLGIVVGDKFFPFSEIKSFWVLYNPPLKQLNFELTKRFSPVISVLIEGTDPVIIKDLLAPHIIEDDTRTEDLVDRVIRFIRF